MVYKLISNTRRFNYKRQESVAQLTPDPTRSIHLRQNNRRERIARPCYEAFVKSQGGKDQRHQMRGEIVCPLRLFTLSSCAEAQLTKQGYPLHLIGEFDDPRIFLAALKAGRASNEHGWQVSALSESDYANMRLFLSMDGSAGFGIKEDGNLVSVFSNRHINPKKYCIPVPLLLAIEQGAQKADCFDGYLPALYARFGFRAVCRIPWNPDMAPAGWSEGYGQPDVIFLAYDGGPRGTLLQRLGTFAPYEPTEVPYADSYDDALKLQAAAIEPSLHRPVQRPKGKHPRATPKVPRRPAPFTNEAVTGTV